MRDALSTVKRGGSKEFVVKEFVGKVKDLLVSLWSMKVAYEEEARSVLAPRRGMSLAAWLMAGALGRV